jgi:GT2 family glycosyltransferase
MISIVVTFYDNRRILELCLSQILPTVRDYDVEVIVVDDNPDRPLARKALAPRSVRLLRSPRNLGYGGACNLGVDAARGAQVLFVDSDIVPVTGWLDCLLRTAREKPTAGAIGAKILDLSAGGIVAYGAAIHGVDTVHPYRGNRATYSLASQSSDFQLMPSGTLLMSREAFQRIGGFDPIFRNAFGDFDLAMKLWEAGTPARICADAVVYHRGAVSGSVRHSNYADTKALFFKRWSSKIQENGLRFLEDACCLLRSRHQLSRKPFLAANLSSSLNWADYLQAASAALNINIVQTYSFPPPERNLSHIRLEDSLDWATCRLRTPILYLVDRFRSLFNNHYWFLHRPLSTDIVIDRNGNAEMVAEWLR